MAWFHFKDHQAAGTQTGDGETEKVVKTQDFVNGGSFKFKTKNKCISRALMLSRLTSLIRRL